MTRAGGVTIERHDDVAVAHVRGELDLATAPAIEPTVSEAIDGAGALIVDLTGVTYFDSSGVRLLDRLSRACGGLGIPIVIVAPEGGRARTVLRIVAFGEGRLVTTLEAGLAAAAAAR